MARGSRLRKGWMTALLVLAALFVLPEVKGHVEGWAVHAAAIVNIPDQFGPNNVAKARIYEGKWKKTESGYRFLRSNGKYARGRWFRYNNAVYLVDADGYRVTGWVKYRDHTYVLGGNGKMHTGWLSYTYYFKPSGRMVINTFYKVKGDIYYFNRSGEKQTGMKTIGKETYFFFRNGKMAYNRWIKDGGKVCWMQKDGKMLKNSWVTVSDRKYYVGPDGNRVTGTQEIEGSWYRFSASGVLMGTAAPPIDASRPMVALTFDDGPSIYTPRLLNCLHENGAHATFFMVGDRVGTYAPSVRKMVEYGCELGNHSMTHTAMTTLSTGEIESEFSRTGANIYAACGHYPTVCRLPYGDGYNNSRVLAAAGLPSIYWSIDTEDWKNTGNSQATVDAVLSQVHSGDIILMHDIHSATVTAAETIIPTLTARGYQLVTVSELAAYKGGTELTVGRTYFSFY